jgi:hypothetical protein
MVTLTRKSPFPNQDLPMLDPQYSSSPSGEDRDGSHMEESSAPENNRHILEPRYSTSPDDDRLMLEPRYSSSPLGEDRDGSHMQESSAPEHNGLILEPRYPTSPDENHPMLDSQYPSSPASENQSANEESEAVECIHRDSLSPDPNRLMLDSQYPSSPPGEDDDGTYMQESSAPEHDRLILEPPYSPSPPGKDPDGSHMKSPSPDQNCLNLDPHYSSSPPGEDRDGSHMEGSSDAEHDRLILEPRYSTSPDDNHPMLDSQYPSSPASENQSGNEESEAVEYIHRDSLSPDPNRPMLDSQYPSSPPGEDHDGTHMEESSAPEHNRLILKPQYSSSPPGDDPDGSHMKSPSSDQNCLKLDPQYSSSPPGEDRDGSHMEDSESSAPEHDRLILKPRYPTSPDDNHPMRDSQYPPSYAENNQDRNRESDDSKLQTSARSPAKAEQAQIDLFGLAYNSETEYPSDPEFDPDEEDKTDTDRDSENDGALWKSRGLQLEENCDNSDVKLDGPSHVLLPVVSRHSGSRAEASYVDESSDDETPLSPQPKVAIESMPRTASTAPNTTNDEDYDEDSSFDYRHIAEKLTSQEKTSFAFHDIGLTHHVSREAVQGFRSLQPDKPFDYRTSRDRIKMLTGVAEVRYDCCVKGCISYSLPKYADLEVCPIEKCKHPRYRNGSGGKLVPYAQHSYIPVAHRLRLMYSDKERAREMMEYTYQCEQDRENNIRSDFWTGELFRDLQAKGLFSLRTDVALALSSDGVKVFKTRSAFYIWPIMLVSTKSVPQQCTRF